MTYTNAGIICGIKFCAFGKCEKREEQNHIVPVHVDGKKGINTGNVSNLLTASSVLPVNTHKPPCLLAQIFIHSCHPMHTDYLTISIFLSSYSITVAVISNCAEQT